MIACSPHKYLLPACLSVLLAAGCGGGGTPATVAITYDGPNSAATVTTVNATDLTATIGPGMATTDAVGFFKGGQVAPVTFPAVTDAVNTALAMVPHTLAPRTKTGVGDYRKVSGSPPGQVSGTLVLAVNIDALAGTGTLRVTFLNDYDNGDGTGVWNGEISVNIGNWDNVNELVVDGTVTFAGLTNSGGPFDLALDGSAALRQDLGGNTETLNIDLDGTLGTDTFRLANVTSVTEYVDITAASPCATTYLMAGRFFHAAHGFVNVNMGSPLVYSATTCNQAYPDSGGPLVLRGIDGGAGGPGTIQVTPINATTARLQIDVHGDGIDAADTNAPWTTTTNLLAAGA